MDPEKKKPDPDDELPPPDWDGDDDWEPGDLADE